MKTFRIAAVTMALFLFVILLSAAYADDKSAGVSTSTTVSATSSVSTTVPQPSMRTKTIGALVLEVSADGDVVDDTVVADDIKQHLSSAGFTVAKLPVSAHFLLGKSDQDINLLLKDIAARRAQIMVVGTATIEGIDKSRPDGIYAKIGTKISVLDMKTNSVLMTFDQEANEQGDTRSHAIAASFDKLGQDIGDQLVKALP